MALPSSGSISLSQVNTELKKSATAVISLNDSNVRKLAGRTTGVISMSDLRGKKASESVSGYQVYNNSWVGKDKIIPLTVTFPHKVISGTITVAHNERGAEMIYKGEGYITGGSTKTFTDSISNAISVNFTIKLIGRDNYPSMNKLNGNASLNIKFTGEWES